MTNILDVSLLDILPESIKNDEKVRAAALTIDQELKKTAIQTNFALIYARLDTLSEELVDELAWQFHVDFYDYSLPIEIKRNLVRRSILWHRKKGTPWAVEQVVSTFLSDSKIVENWEYGGDAYCFKVKQIGGALPDEKTLNNLVKAIMSTKNTRSWLDGVSFLRNLNSTIYYGGATQIFRKIHIYPKKFEMPDLAFNKFMGGAVRIFRKISIYPRKADVIILSDQKVGSGVYNIKEATIWQSGVKGY
ncbi:phage tail protein I [Selenomonadales bacterium OttesenSCG-928-I06]|nr:phage tail protein I [Selenomonadales bacterium OttesenSCG-928-I06]